MIIVLGSLVESLFIMMLTRNLLIVHVDYNANNIQVM